MTGVQTCALPICYLLSPGDLYALEQIPEIVEIGISALKIEGRYKDAAYVALTTRAYRQAVDDAWAGRASHADKLQLEQVYSRGLGPYFLTGTDHQAVVNGRAPRHRGVLMGRVTRITPTGVIVEPAEAGAVSPLKPGDGVVFDAADWRSPEEPEEGGRVFEVSDREIRFGNGVLDSNRIRQGDLVWRTHSPGIDRAARPYLEATTPLRKQPVDVHVAAREGAPLETEWRVGKAHVIVKSDVALGAATNRPVTVEHLREQLGRLGNTPYELANVELQTEGQPFAPASLLNRVRREAVERLQEAQGSVGQVVNLRTGCHSVQPGAARLIDVVPQTLTPHAAPALHLLVRTPDQLQAALAVRPASITLDYLDLYGLKPSLERVRAAGIAARVASPRVLKPGEERIVDFLLSCECPILVRCAGLLHQLREKPHAELIGDFSLNAANTITAAEFLAMGLQSLTPAHDLNAAQVTALAQGVGGDRLEAILYQHLPVFHTEHCVFCRFLSTGTSYRDCGRPCESHVVELRDPAGRAHPVMADVGCRNTVFGAEAQEASLHLDEWRIAGIAHFRLEFAHESGEQVRGISGAFADCLAGRISPHELGKQLRRLTPHGTSEGSLFVPAGYRELPILQ